MHFLSTDQDLLSQIHFFLSTFHSFKVYQQGKYSMYVCSMSLLSASGILGAKSLGIEPILSAEEICEETSEHLGIMAYAAGFLNLNPGAVTYQHNYREIRVRVKSDTIIAVEGSIIFFFS